MSVTPEGKIKKLVTSYLNDLDKAGIKLYWTMFVPVGYGKRNALDYTVCFNGHYVGIETKAPNEWLTPLQRFTCRDIHEAGGAVFIISGMEGLDAFKRWVIRKMGGHVK